MAKRGRPTGGVKKGGRDFPKGVSQNPAGRKKDTWEVKEAKRLNSVTVPVIIDKFMSMDRGELGRILDDPETPAMELILARVIFEAAKRGDHTRLGFLFDRLLGKQAENLNVKAQVHTGVVHLIREINNARKAEKASPDNSRDLLSLPKTSSQKDVVE